jgi:hypothetical protein
MKYAALIPAAGLLLLVGCGGPGSTGPTVGPMAGAIATQAVATTQPVAAEVAATAAVVAPTAAAAATQVAPTVQAAAAAAGTAIAAAPVQLVEVRFGVPDTTLTLRNTSQTPVDLAGWKLRAGDASVTLPTAAQIAPGGTVTIHTASGASTAGEVYLGQEAATLVTNLRSGTRVALVNDQGATVAEMTLP